MTFEQWMEDYDIEWKMPLMGSFIYNGVDCVVLLTAMYSPSTMDKEIVSAQIRPKERDENIGKGAGQSVIINFH